MLTKNNEAVQEAAANLYIANSDEIVRQQCRAREDAERRERTLARNNRLLKKELAEKDQVIAEEDKEIRRLKEMLQKAP